MKQRLLLLNNVVMDLGYATSLLRHSTTCWTLLSNHHHHHPIARHYSNSKLNHTNTSNHTLYHPISEGFFEWSKRLDNISSLAATCKEQTLHHEEKTRIPSSSDSLQLILLANASYSQSLALQTYLFDFIKSQKSNSRRSQYLIATEHVESCFTIGKLRFDETFSQRHFIKNDRELKIYKIGRGGGITFHGPGQLVLYPIFDLETSRVLMRNIKWFSDEFMLKTLTVPVLQEFVNSMVATKESFSNKCDLEKGDGSRMHLTNHSPISLHVGGESEMGIYSEIHSFKENVKMKEFTQQLSSCCDQPHEQIKSKRKLASIGLQLSRWCTMHGIAINLDLNERDLKTFREDIVACGLQHVTMTSLAQEIERVKHEQHHDVVAKDIHEGNSHAFSFTTGHYGELLSLLLKHLQRCQFQIDDILLVDGLQTSKSRWLLKPECTDDSAKDKLLQFIKANLSTDEA
ncbi:hypothetical protein C9374_004786 [Naegleria lovaniensis]|uniref:BPL/LPL catalytic domain-containing protein n=1 Tax=Naegleria lovaniensis TaxID=51637 RepID=A0AA88KIH5_NAELO|nr:uncharacterized protein C9374_004786 [Naegleria lovaniensis]KAG2382819.1 hypothetical protein C9374_004786 [Naegleria lovaniensis]